VRVSLITPTLNRVSLLRLTMASVRLQRHSNIEYIVMDGGSTDGTINLLRAAEAKWGITWASGSDGGMYEAINAGLERATGDVVGWINDDDWLMPWSISTAIAVMSESGFSKPVYGDYLSANLTSDYATVTLMPPYNRRRLAATGYLPQPTVLWPRYMTDLLGPLDTTTFRQIADCDYWLRMSALTDFVRIREVQAVDTHHPATKRESLSQQITDEFSLLRLRHAGRSAPSVLQRAANSIVSRRALKEFERDELCWANARTSKYLEWERKDNGRQRVGIALYRKTLAAMADELTTGL
jgi:glycosyltransferase involved in cell wall biosynthesis